MFMSARLDLADPPLGHREGARFVLYSSDRRLIHNAIRTEFGQIRAVGAEITGETTGDIGESQEEI